MLPKRKTSRANTRSRRANWKATAVAVSECPKCGLAKRSHVACPACGAYKERQIVEAVRSDFA